MDSKTRVLTALAHRKPDRVPFNFWMDRRLMARYEERIGHRHWRVTHYGADVIETFLGLDFPAAPSIERDGTTWHTGPLFDNWSQAKDLPLPDPRSDGAYALVKADLDEFPDRAIILDCGTPFGIIAHMRTYERLYMDLVDYPEEVHRLARRIAEIFETAVDRACRMGITALYLMEDLATTRGLALSGPMIREFSLDYGRRYADIARRYGLPVLFHSDGCVTDLLPLLVEIGVDAVNPLQPNLNDPAAFKKQFGHKLALYGGLDNCFIIPDGTPKDVRDHVLNVFDIVGRPDGALIFSSHDIPLHTPEANVEMLVQTIKQECRYA